jgi:hypothetical protein
MLYGAPRLGLPTLELRFTFSDLPFFRLRQQVIGVNQFLGLHEDPAGFGSDLHKVPFLKLQRLKNYFRYHNLSALANAAYGGPARCG